MHGHGATRQHIERGVACQEGRQTLVVEQVQRRQQGIQQAGGQRVARWRIHTQAREIGPGLVDRGGEVGRHAHIQADADHRARRPGMLAPAFHQDAAQLGATGQQIVGPLHADAVVARLPERFGDGHTDHQTQAAQPCEAAGKLPGHRQVQVRRDRRCPMPASAPASAGLLFGQQHRGALRGRLAAQEFAVGGVQRPCHFEGRHRTCLPHPRENAFRFQQFDRRRESVAPARPRIDAYTPLAQGFDALPYRRARLPDGTC